MGMAYVTPLEERHEWRMTLQNIPIYVSQGIPEGMVVFRNAAGEVIGVISHVAEMRIGALRS